MSVTALPSRTCLHQLVKAPGSKTSRGPQQKDARALQFVHRQSLVCCSGHARRVSLLLLQPSSCWRTVSCQAQETLQTNSLKCVSDRRKSQLQHELIDANRGIFGIKAAKAEAIGAILTDMEESATAQNSTADLSHLSGTWQLLYTTLVIKGARKTKLGLREFVSLGDFEQIIDIESRKATNKVHFSVTGLGNLSGSLTIVARFQPISAKRVQITFESANLVPRALERLFASNYDMLLSIFNPEGWLDITYVDDTHRIGRDDKGNVFYLQRP